ncbi:MAG TPA: hypothetical protein VIT45_00875 [Allosphingosinicella sp.]
MKPAPLLLFLLAGCAGSQAPYSPARDVRYSALGQDPFWMVTIGDDKIVLALAPAEGGKGKLTSHDYRRVLPRTVDGVKSWESADGTAVILVEARAEPCRGSRGEWFEDRVRVRLSGRELHGCGGRMLETRTGR